METVRSAVVRKVAGAATETRFATAEEIKESVDQEREWLNENNGISAVNGGPVEDLQGVPLPADFCQPEIQAHSTKVSKGI